VYNLIWFCKFSCGSYCTSAIMLRTFVGIFANSCIIFSFFSFLNPSMTGPSSVTLLSSLFSYSFLSSIFLILQGRDRHLLHYFLHNFLILFHLQESVHNYLSF